MILKIVDLVTCRRSNGSYLCSCAQFFLCFVLITVTVRVLQPAAVCSNHALQLTRTLQLCLVKPGKHVQCILLCIYNTGVNSAQFQILCSYTLLLYSHHSYLLVEKFTWHGILQRVFNMQLLGFRL